MKAKKKEKMSAKSSLEVPLLNKHFFGGGVGGISITFFWEVPKETTVNQDVNTSFN